MAEPIGTVFCKATQTTQWERFMVGQKKIYFLKFWSQCLQENPQNFEFYNYVKKWPLEKQHLKTLNFLLEEGCEASSKPSIITENIDLKN